MTVPSFCSGSLVTHEGWDSLVVPDTVFLSRGSGHGLSQDGETTVVVVALVYVSTVVPGGLGRSTKTVTPLGCAFVRVVMGDHGTSPTLRTWSGATVTTKSVYVYFYLG